MLRQKVNVLKKDITHQNTIGYLQVVSEVELVTDPVVYCKEFFIRVFSPARKLAPLRVRQPPVKLEKTERLKVNVHVVKGYNVPIRQSAFSTDQMEKMRLYSAG